jgi:polyisoprenoid-binding protein YceI
MQPGGLVSRFIAFRQSADVPAGAPASRSASNVDGKTDAGHGSPSQITAAHVEGFRKASGNFPAAGQISRGNSAALATRSPRFDFGMGVADSIAMIPAIQRLRHTACLFLIFEITLLCASAQESTLQLDPSRTAIQFTLDAALHTVHGTFQVKQGELRLNPASGVLSGEILVDARSGQTGNGMRDRKMHKDVLESQQYPEILFRPDRVIGPVTLQGKFAVKIHGIFNIHGVNREIEVPAEVEMSGTSWTANVHFTIPYARWGMKNPSMLFLRVGDSVEIDLAATGNIGSAGTPSSGSAQ